MAMKRVHMHMLYTKIHHKLLLVYQHSNVLMSAQKCITKKKRILVLQQNTRERLQGSLMLHF